MIITCCTADYRKYADRLIASLPREERDDSWICDYENQGSWERNCLTKPLEAESAWLESYVESPLWIFDADLEYVGGDLDPLWNTLRHADMAVHEHDLAMPQNRWRRDRTDSHVSAGVVGFAPTKFGRAALAYWAQACLEWKPEWTGQGGVLLPEQYLLKEARDFCEKIDGLVAPIDIRFNARLEDLDEKDIVIRHVPASREMRR